jgi:hypothetical protein
LLGPIVVGRGIILYVASPNDSARIFAASSASRAGLTCSATTLLMRSSVAMRNRSQFASPDMRPRPAISSTALAAIGR